MSSMKKEMQTIKEIKEARYNSNMRVLTQCVTCMTEHRLPLNVKLMQSFEDEVRILSLDKHNKEVDKNYSLVCQDCGQETLTYQAYDVKYY